MKKAKSAQDKILQTKDYDPSNFQGLNHFFLAKQYLIRSKYQVRNLGDVIVKHKMHDKFGINLLHKHFSLMDDELLKRSTYKENRIVHIKPSTNAKDLVPYLWKAEKEIKGSWKFIPLEFVDKNEIDFDISQIERKKLNNFLDDLANTLDELHLTNVYGIALTNVLTISCDEDELLVETTDEENRLLTINIENRSNVKVEELTETFWTFTPSVNIRGVVSCTGAHCREHCNNHCKAHCKTHCKDHNLLANQLEQLIRRPDIAETIREIASTR